MMRGVLPFALAALALSACAPEDGKKDKESAPLPLGFEIASAKAATETARPTVIDLSVRELKTMLAEEDVRLIDVRTAEEVAQGMIPGAEHIAMDEFELANPELSEEGEIVLYCRSGRRSRILGEKLAAKAGMPVKHLSGGIIAWNVAERDE